MIELGKIQKLEVLRSTTVGVFLNVNEEKKIEEIRNAEAGSQRTNDEDILLPRKQVPEGIEIGDEIEVFVYRDSKDRMIATTSTPKLKMDECAFLKVVEVTEIGAFLDWGLEKDLLLPFKEQTERVHTNKKYLVSLYVDKTNRLCATMKVYLSLRFDSPYNVDDKVTGRVYSIKEDMGVFVAVDNKYHGLIPPNEIFKEYEYGDLVQVRVTKVKEDGKLDLSTKEKAYVQMNSDVKLILDIMLKNDGKLNLNDKSSPDDIKNELNMSKNAFKRSLGRLLKAGRVRQTENGIELT